MRIDTIRERVTSVVTGDPFRFEVAETPFDFDLQPAGGVDRAVRLETEASEVIGGFNYSEERTDSVHVWVARKHTDDTEGTYRSLVDDAWSQKRLIRRVQPAGSPVLIRNEGSPP